MTTFSAEFAVPLPDGRCCAVRVAVPPGLMPPGGWPVAYVLDLSQFDTMRETAGADGLPGILVGLAPQAPTQRVWDYTPRHWLERFAADRTADVPPQARPAGYQAADPLPDSVQTGAAHWLHTLDTVRARVAADFRLDPRRQALAGHSLGALFALYVLLHRADAFDGYVLSSPSVWWGQGYVRRLVRRRRAWLEKQGVPGLGVALTVGEYEQGLSPQEMSLSPQERQQQLIKREHRAMVDGVQGLAADLATCPGLRLRHEVLPGHIHRTAPQDALMAGWRWLLGSA
ncbi:alpha/beta hydrolase [Castellaniella sp.]|uniref:alpha/beta hydrolase n=1 Tax=Castellaniella sp. TaxID=1955812 RepID=UPI002AFE5657|nr:alpha/beta hydrolase-fold protein [Castellaniella sp.]